MTRYAGKIIQDSCGALRRVAFIPHGVGEAFARTRPLAEFPTPEGRPIRCLYVSPISRYKHQWVVVRAIEMLRRRGFSLQLDLVGGGDEAAQNRLEEQIRNSDLDGLLVRQLGHVPQSVLPELFAYTDLFVFASSCETMPVTLLEAMAVGLPIACSDRGPMPEVLEDGGVYFDPESPESIARAIENIITDAEQRTRIARRAKELAGQYSWKRCAEETFAFITETYQMKIERDL